jgi:Icc-related predicted phosphoesterase
MRLLAFGDFHIKAGGQSLNYDGLEVPEGVDAVVSIGDVVHRITDADVAAGREFFERVVDAGVPVVAVPGNHDPDGEYERLVGGLPTAVNAHERVVDGTAFGGDGDPLDGHAIVGWGCEGFDFKPEIRVTDFDALDPRSAPRSERRHASDRAATRLEDALFGYVTADGDPDELRERLGVRRGERTAFREQLDRTLSTFETLDGLLSEASGFPVVCTHIPPYNTPLDRHHSVGRREADLEGLHVGSIGLKLALRKHRPIAALSGHSHNGEYQSGVDGTAGRPHMLNVGFRGIVDVEFDGDAGAFGFDVHHRA